MEQENNQKEQNVSISATDEIDEIQEIEEIEEEYLESRENSAKKKSLILPLVFFILVAIVIGIIFRTLSSQNEKEDSSTTETTETIEQAQLPVRVVEVSKQPIQEWVFADGYVSAVDKRHLIFETDGTITYMKKVDGRELREGDLVKKGEVLARLDRRKSDADLTVSLATQLEAKNQVLAAQAQLRQAEQSLIQSQAELEKAKTELAFAEADYIRYKELGEQGAIQLRDVEVKKTEYDNALANLKVAEAEVKSMEVSIETAQTELEIAESGVKKATAELDKTKVDREDYEIVAPFTGIISHLNIRDGEYWDTQRVQASSVDYQTITEQVPIIITPLDSEFDVYVSIPPFQGNSVSPRQRAIIALDESGRNVSGLKNPTNDPTKNADATGRVFSVSPSVSPGERSVNVRIRVPSGFRSLKDGARVSAWIAVKDNSNTEVIPSNALIFRDGNPHVFVVNRDQGIVEKREVELGIEGFSSWEIISGVRTGELVVTDGKDRLVDGAPITIVK